nr:hypothetical protein [Klebsiella pneumoniae]
MDSLSHLLALLAPRCEVNLHCRFGGRWQAGHQQMRSGVVPWHVVLRGEARRPDPSPARGRCRPPAPRFAAPDGEPGGVGPGAAGGAPV